MTTKSSNLYVRIEPNIKMQAEKILTTLGISSSSAINMFYNQIILRKGLPFEVTIPDNIPVDMSELSDADMNKELEKAISDSEQLNRVRFAQAGQNFIVHNFFS